MRGEILKRRASIKTPAELCEEFFEILKGTEGDSDDDSDGDKGALPSAIPTLEEDVIKTLTNESATELSDRLELIVMEALNSFFWIESIDKDFNVSQKSRSLS